MTSMTFSIKYDGPALAQHEMDLHELAPALLALSEMIKSANRSLFGDKSEVQVKVQGSFKGGSFGIDLMAVQTMYEQLSSLLAGQGPTAFGNLKTILESLGLIGGAGLLALLKRLRGRKPTEIEFRDNSAILTVINEEVHERIVTDLATGQLWQDKTVRKTLHQVMRPLQQDGIEIFAAGRTPTPEIVITRAEAEWFTFDENVTELNSSIIEQVCLIESVTFKDDNKWKLNNGQTFYAFMEDLDFLSSIENGTVRFGKGDRLKVSMKIVQSDRNRRLETTYHVLKVIEHRIAHAPQLFN
jgi:hypothetical protein